MSDQPIESEALTDERISADEAMAAADDEAIDPDIRDPLKDREGAELAREANQSDRDVETED